jgi:hypothetical protein
MLRRYRFYVPGKICSCGEGTPASDAPAGRGPPLVRSCGAGTPARAAPVERGRPLELLLQGGAETPEATVWRILGASNERVIH